MAVKKLIKKAAKKLAKKKVIKKVPKVLVPTKQALKLHQWGQDDLRVPHDPFGYETRVDKNGTVTFGCGAVKTTLSFIAELHKFSELYHTINDKLRLVDSDNHGWDLVEIMDNEDYLEDILKASGIKTN